MGFVLTRIEPIMKVYICTAVDSTMPVIAQETVKKLLSGHVSSIESDTKFLTIVGTTIM